MKKIIISVICGLMICQSGYSVSTCKKNNTYIAVFKNNVNGTSSESNSTTKVWKVVFDYETLTGDASCNEISGTANTPKTNLVTGSGDTGIHCWCRMWPVEDYGYETGPSSYWMYLSSYADAPTCASGCTSACETAVKTNTTFRTAMFESMW